MTEEQKEHILPLRLYVGVTAALFALTGLTVAVSYVHLGALNVIVAIGIAAIKVSLVALFFMHLKYDKKINLFVSRIIKRTAVLAKVLHIIGHFFNLTD